MAYTTDRNLDKNVFVFRYRDWKIDKRQRVPFLWKSADSIQYHCLHFSLP
jgi:hypothetical protein